MVQEDLTEQTKKLYEEEDTVWPENDSWHKKTKNHIDHVVIKLLNSINNSDIKILNAGSGGTHYNTCGIYYDCDIAEKTIAHCKHPILASVENLPCPDNFFDVAICVGSVINYCDAVLVISELHRTLNVGGNLILEFERSNSGGFLFTGNHNKTAFQNVFDYNGDKHKLWLYLEKYIRKILEKYNFSIEKTDRFHTLSSLVARLTNNGEKSAKYMKYDKYFRLLSYQLSHNVILFCQKIR